MWDWLTGENKAAEEAVKFLTKYEDYLHFQGILEWMWNSIVWGLIKLLYYLNTALEKLLLHSFDVGDFLKDKGLTQLQSDFAVTLGSILLVITASIIGIRMMISKSPPSFKQSLIMLVTAVFLLIYSGTIVNQLFDLSKNAFTNVTQLDKNAPSLQIIQDNTSDLITVLKNGEDNLKQEGNLNKITKENFKYIDFNETITPEQISGIKDKIKNKENIKYLDRKLTTTDKGEVTAVVYKDSFITKMFQESGYRRYPASTGTIIAGEGSLAVGYLFIIFSIVMCIFELAYKKTYLLAAVATDLDTGQRRNKALEGVAQSLLLIAFTGLELNIYIRIIDFLGSKNFDPLLYIICLVVSTVLLFKGSQSVAQIFGVDTSLKNGGSSLLSAIGMASVLKNSASSAGHATVGAGKKGLNRIRGKGNSTDTDPDSTDNPEGDGPDTGGSGTGPKRPNGSSRMRDMANKAGKFRGYMSEKGLGGAMEDGVTAAKDKAGEAAGAAVDKVTSPVKKAKELGKDLKENYEHGVVDGVASGLDKKSSDTKDGKSEETGGGNAVGFDDQTRAEDPTIPKENKAAANLPKREMPEGMSATFPGEKNADTTKDTQATGTRATGAGVEPTGTNPKVKTAPTHVKSMDEKETVLDHETKTNMSVNERTTPGTQATGTSSSGSATNPTNVTVPNAQTTNQTDTKKVTSNHTHDTTVTHEVNTTNKQTVQMTEKAQVLKDEQEKLKKKLRGN
ncbi:pLS20_p028 family conjugation system transmembrane protein [Enterococcus faecalis]